MALFSLTIELLCTIFPDITFEFDQLVYDTSEGGFGMVMVCVNLVGGILSRPVQIDVLPKPSDPLIDSATRKSHIGFWFWYACVCVCLCQCVCVRYFMRYIFIFEFHPQLPVITISLAHHSSSPLEPCLLDQKDNSVSTSSLSSMMTCS